jgi:hypothetical protein
MPVADSATLRRNTMAKHSLRLTAEQLRVTSRDIEVRVHSRDDDDDRAILGTLKISKGSIDWRDAHDQFSHVMSWERFAQLAKKSGRKVKRR